jgi:hypothetical protein
MKLLINGVEVPVTSRVLQIVAEIEPEGETLDGIDVTIKGGVLNVPYTEGRAGCVVIAAVDGGRLNVDGVGGVGSPLTIDGGAA